MAIIDPRTVRNIRAIKRKGDSFDVTEEQAQKIDEAKKMKEESIKIIDKETGRLLFWGDPHEIKEFAYTDDDYKKKVFQSETQDQIAYESEFMKRKKLRDEWTANKLKELTEDEIEYFRDMARYNMRYSIEKGNIGPKVIEHLAMVYLRKHFSCPYSR